MIKYTPKHQVKVGGKMLEKAADKVGNKLANAATHYYYLLGYKRNYFCSSLFC